MVEPTIQQGLEHHQAGRLAQAEAIYRAVLAREPRNSDARHLLGAIAYEVQNLPAAVELVGGAIQLNPRVASYHNTLGLVFTAQRRLDDAVNEFRAALQLQPELSDVHFNLASALHQQGKLEQAIDHYRQSPNRAAAQVNLGSALSKLDRLDEALIAYRRAVELQPDLAEAHYNLGNALRKTDQFEPAVASYRVALNLHSAHCGALINLGNLLKDKGELDEAIDCFRQAMQVNPDDPEAHSNLLYTMQLHWRFDPRQIYDEHVLWRQRHADSLKATIQAHLNSRDPHRRLRIGYVSPDFREHAVARFMLPLLRAHDREHFQIVCYSNAAKPDTMTQTVRSLADEWRDISDESDDQVAARIRNERIDILVDLALHTGHNRLLTFARRPAPVQITYLAYCGTSGLNTIEYRITDPLLDPEGENDAFYSERSIRLPRTYWCYACGDPDIEINPLPMQSNGFATFGCLNNFCKVTEPTLETWARILAALPGSRLVLHTLEGADPSRARNVISRHGVDDSRITFVGHVPFGDYLRLHHTIDIALDPFPYNGGTTTCDALWMGVPVVSLAGRRAVERAGLSLLSNVGLAELVAEDQNDYVKIAIALAGDPARLAELRSSLRRRMLESPLTDAPRFARDLETIYRNVWQRWCES